MNQAFEKAIAAKNARRKRLAQLPIHKKIEIVVQLQKLAAPLLRAQGRRAVVWGINTKTRRHEGERVSAPVQSFRQTRKINKAVKRH